MDILLTVYNGMPFLDEQIASLQEQSYRDWVLWVRDDGSEDATVPTIRRLAAVDDRIQLLDSDGGDLRLGAKRGFAWLLDQVRPEAEYLMFCDADDRWLPDKIAATLDVMRHSEGDTVGGARRVPTLVHTDLVVVDQDLEPIEHSLWAYQGLKPELTGLNRLLIQNCVTGCTVMINRPLRELAAPIPGAAVMHDWWLALVATSFGRVVNLPRATVLYRQHGRNDTGAYQYPRSAGQRAKRAWSAMRDATPVRDSLLRTARQAEALLERFGDRLPPESRELVRRYAEIPRCGAVTRRLRLLELGTLLHSLDRNLGLLLRA